MSRITQRFRGWWQADLVSTRSFIMLPLERTAREYATPDRFPVPHSIGEPLLVVTGGTPLALTSGGALPSRQPDLSLGDERCVAGLPVDTGEGPSRRCLLEANVKQVVTIILALYVQQDQTANSLWSLFFGLVALETNWRNPPTLTPNPR